MSYLDDDDYSLDDYPCFGAYDPREPGCNSHKCKFHTACRAETGAQARRNSAQQKAIAVTSHNSPIQIAKKPTQQLGSVGVFHTNFTPYAGESVVQRVMKNAVLDGGATVLTSLAQFLATFDWRPKQESPPPLRIVEVDSNDEET